MLLALFKKYNVAVPANELPAEIAPATLRAACEAGVRSEKENIALYDKFLKDVKEPDIRRVFTALRDASQLNHVPAFERCAAGRGQGRGQGRR
jgi:rubrerythrin